MPKITFEAEFDEKHVKFEDSKQALIWDHHGYEIDGDEPEEADAGASVKFWSWDENCEHKSIKRFIGKRVRVTVEVVSILDQLAEIPVEDEDIERMLAKWSDLSGLTDAGLRVLRHMIGEELRRRYKAKYAHNDLETP